SETPTACSSSPCVNDGICIPIASKSRKYFCNCPAYTVGPHCQISTKLCLYVCGRDECYSFSYYDELTHVCLCSAGNYRSKTGHLSFEITTYGPNCQQTYENPCLNATVTDELFPLAYTNQGYINCTGPSELYQRVLSCQKETRWNQQLRTCLKANGTTTALPLYDITRTTTIATAFANGIMPEFVYLIDIENPSESGSVEICRRSLSSSQFVRSTIEI
ncbi:unnamed protein product, partial [Didymodactylos carnosus]